MSSSNDNVFERTVNAWDDFQNQWGGLHNFMMGGDLVAEYDFPLPSAEQVVEEVRHAKNSLVRSGIKQDAFDLTDIKEQFLKTPLEQALRGRFVLANFDFQSDLTGPGKVLEAIDERWVEPWRKKLIAHDFSFEKVFPIFFASGPNSASNYHMDITHQLAWQRYGTKHFCGLRDPDRWTTEEQRGRCQLAGTVKPSGIGERDTYSIIQPPGSVLWNAVLTPHWVETFDQPAVTLTLVHTGLRYKGELCPHAQQRERWLKNQEAAKTQEKRQPAMSY